MADLGLAKVLETQNHGQITPTTSEDDLDDKADDFGHKKIYPDWSGPIGTQAWMAPCLYYCRASTQWQRWNFKYRCCTDFSPEGWMKRQPREFLH